MLHTVSIKNRWTGSVIFTAEIEATDDTPLSVKLGLAVKVAVKARANLAGANLAGANLAGANLAGAYLADAYLADANLADANLARANLADAYLADAYLARANLADAYLADANLERAYLADANLERANLADAYLARANLADANLADANLADANLERAYLADAVKVEPEEIPVIPNIDAQILAAIETSKAAGKAGLAMGLWHTCATTHCRAGWAITLGGEKGAALEKRVGPFLAGCMIYSASRPGEPPPHFFASTDAALADIRACAAKQAQS